MTTIAIIGPGAIGGALAASLLPKPANEVALCARSSFETLTIRTAGAEQSYRPTIHTQSSAATPADWVIIATKTYQMAAAAKWLKALAHSATRVAVVQNGVEHRANIAPYFDPERVVPVIIDCPVERKGPGQLVRHGPVRMAVPNSADASAFAALFDAAPEVAVALSDDWTTEAWRKLCVNCCGAICPLLNQPANIARDPLAAQVMREFIRECIAVGRAEGAVLDDSLVETIVAGQRAAPEGAMNSLHADFVARRPMEWSARNAVIGRLGAKHGIPAPRNSMAAELLQLLEAAYLPRD